MNLARYATLGLSLLTFGAAVPVAPPKPSPSSNPSERTIVARARATQTSDLYSPRARRLVRAYLRLRMLELREGDFDRVRAVIEHKLSVDELLREPETPESPTQYKRAKP